ncbi:MAG TPA: PAS domain-containing protein, partial [Spirochaetota bacterium]|nr:PAS domain-containing protein [Spirochaetota bacterium]
MTPSNKEKNSQDNIESVNIKTLLDVSIDAAFLINNDFKLIALNKEALRRIKKNNPELKNKPLSYFIGKHLNQFYPLDFLEEVNKFRKQVLKKNKPERFRYNLNGRMLDIIGYPIIDKDNPCCNFAVYSRDITKEIEADSNAKKNEDKFRNLVEQMHEGFVIIDKNGRIEYANRIAYSFTEYSSRELIGKKYLHFIAPEDREKAMYYHSNALNSGNVHFDASILTKSGIRKAVRFSVAPLFDEDNNYIG